MGPVVGRWFRNECFVVGGLYVDKTLVQPWNCVMWSGATCSYWLLAHRRLPGPRIELEDATLCVSESIKMGQQSKQLRHGSGSLYDIYISPLKMDVIFPWNLKSENIVVRTHTHTLKDIHTHRSVCGSAIRPWVGLFWATKTGRGINKWTNNPIAWHYPPSFPPFSAPF